MCSMNFQVSLGDQHGSCSDYAVMASAMSWKPTCFLDKLGFVGRWTCSIQWLRTHISYTRPQRRWGWPEGVGSWV